MRRHRLIVAVLIAAATGGIPASLAAPPAPTAVGASDLATRIRLSCSGVMTTDDRESPIMADGLVDLASMRVSGFGIGPARIVAVTPDAIGFGEGADVGVDRLTTVAEPVVSNARGDPAASTIVEGSIDRTSGTTRIVVRSARDTARVILAMVLDCRMEPALR